MINTKIVSMFTFNLLYKRQEQRKHCIIQRKEKYNSSIHNIITNQPSCKKVTLLQNYKKENHK